MEDFIFEQRVADATIDRYNLLLPVKLIDFWKIYGFGSIAQGYIKVINPDEYISLLNAIYTSPIHAEPIPMMITGLGDFIVWENGYTVLVNLRKGDTSVIESGFDFFLDDLFDDDFLSDELEISNYPEAVVKEGELAFDECFAYFPLLGMGGTERVDNLKKVKIREYIFVVAQALGQIR